jgi:hypothetical protein
MSEHPDKIDTPGFGLSKARHFITQIHELFAIFFSGLVLAANYRADCSSRAAISPQIPSYMAISKEPRWLGRVCSLSKWGNHNVPNALTVIIK